MIRIIVAINRNGVIGKNGKIPWHRPGDLKYFADRTLGDLVIMGRKTFESIGHPLYGRVNFVVSRRLQNENVHVCQDFKEAIFMAKKMERDIWIIGGQRIYEEAMTIADQIILTIIPDDTKADGDAVIFPDFTRHNWAPVERTINPYDKELIIYTLERENQDER